MSGLGRKLGRLKMPGGGPPALEPTATATTTATATATTTPTPTATPSGGFGADKRTRIERLRAQMEFAARRPQQERVRRSLVSEHVLEHAVESTSTGVGLPGERVEGEGGALRLVRTELEVDHRHGAVAVGSALEACPEQLSVLALDPALREVDLRRALFVDTETTGLAGGAGTIPFLIGVAFFEDGRLVVEQYLLEQLGQEGPMLKRLSAHLTRASCLVSYNGKSFDWPLLRTRFVLHRVPARPPEVHLDLLHCARRVFKRRLGGVRLTTIEEEVLGFTRIDDMPGALIPETYLGYLRGRVAGEALQPIIEHNRHDLVALAALLGELSMRFSSDGEGQDVRDRVGMAQTAARAAQTDRAIRLAEAAAECDVRGELASHASWLAGCWAKRQGDHVQSERAFRRALEHARDTREAAAAHLELAKLLEHQLRRPAEALVHARQTACAEGEDGCARRVERLVRRLARDRPSPPSAD